MGIPQIGSDLSKSHSYFAEKRCRYHQIGRISGECKINGLIQHSKDFAEKEDAYRLESIMLSRM